VSIPRPEHPRPDFERADWLNLNGPWQFEIDTEGMGEGRGWASGRDLAQEILVPFCPESALSGIGHTDFMEHVWYRRHFDAPAAMQGRRLLLHFGAVDWLAKVWLNGVFLGEHRGGYTPFTFDITAAARPEGNELVLHVVDLTRSGAQASGKQCHERDSRGCSYTRTTGIWQTVWVEAVGECALRTFALTPDLDGGRVLFQGEVDGPQAGTTIRLRASVDGRVVGEEVVKAAWRGALGVLNLSEITPWHPGEPFLYDLEITVERDGQVTDRVQSYFGLRKITIEGHRFLINDRPVFQRLILDQGFYPDGIYTAPTEDALRRDIEISMAAGFNGARLHQKVFEPRFLYWADRLGYIVWGEYADWGLGGRYENRGLAGADQVAVGHAVEEWREAVRRDRNHPSIVGWCPLNETNGGDRVASIQQFLAATQDIDPTRPMLSTSGYHQLYPGTDVYDCHDYCQDPAAFAERFAPFDGTAATAWNNHPADARSAYHGQPYFVSEYGGIRIVNERDKDEGWGYGGESVVLETFFERYKALTDVLLDNAHMFAFCYTQLTDIEQEQNGLVYYDREPKYDLARLKAINERPAAYEI